MKFNNNPTLYRGNAFGELSKFSSQAPTVRQCELSSAFKEVERRLAARTFRNFRAELGEGNVAKYSVVLGAELYVEVTPTSANIITVFQGHSAPFAIVMNAETEADKSFATALFQLVDGYLKQQN